MAKMTLIKPIITEKADMLTETLNQYSFVVDRKANKLEIKKAVEKMYEVKVAAVNTAIMPAKAKNRNTRAGYIRGHVSSYKKAVVTLAEGYDIDFFGDI